MNKIKALGQQLYVETMAKCPKKPVVGTHTGQPEGEPAGPLLLRLSSGRCRACERKALMVTCAVIRVAVVTAAANTTLKAEWYQNVATVYLS